MKTKLSIIICTHNRYDTLGEAIASIETQDCPAEDFELIIVDNSSDLVGQRNFIDGLDIVCQHQLILESVPGLSRARNIGVRSAKGNLVAFMDDDARATGNWALGIIETFASQEKAGIVGGPVRPIWPNSRPSWLHPWLEGYLTIVDRGASPRVLDEHEWLAGTNIAFRREPLLAAGLFNENLGRIGKILLSNEELAVTSKMKEAGLSAFYNPALEVHHRVHADRISQSWMRKRVFWQVVSDLFSDVRTTSTLEQDVSKILEYVMKLSPKDRGLSGLFLDVDQPQLFYEQTEALAILLRLAGTDGRDWRAFLDTKIS